MAKVVSKAVTRTLAGGNQDAGRADAVGVSEAVGRAEFSYLKPLLRKCIRITISS